MPAVPVLAHRNSWLRLALVLFTLSAPAARAGNVWWYGYQDGCAYFHPGTASWFDASNWLGYVRPGLDDRGVFGLTGNPNGVPTVLYFGDYCVSLAGCPNQPLYFPAATDSIGGLVISADEYVFDMGSGSAFCSPPGSATGRLGVKGDVLLSTGDAGGTVQTVRLDVLHGDLNVGGHVYVGNAGNGVVPDSAALYLSQGGRVHCAGTLYDPTYWTLHHGRVDVADSGSEITAGNLEVGDSNGGSGNVGTFIVHDGGQVTVAGFVEIGISGGTGHLAVTSGGTITQTSPTALFEIGSAYGGPSTAGDVTVDNGQIHTSSAIRVGGTALGSMVVSNGGHVSCGLVSVGRDSLGVGTLTVSGSGTQFQCVGSSYYTPNLNVGYSGTGTLVVRGGAAATAGNLFAIGVNRNGLGVATVQDSASSVRAPFVFVGYAPSISGTLHVFSGATVTADSAFSVLPRGRLDGDGTVAGVLRNLGVIDPGHTVGQLRVDGTFRQDSTGTLAVQLAGTNPGVTYDRLSVSGAAAVEGVLDVALAPGFVPATGTQFEVLRAASVTGTFRTVQLHGFYGHVDYPGDRVVLTVDGFAAVSDRAPARLSLSAGAPNPFHASTDLAFSLPVAGHARLCVYDVSGRIVARLVDRELPAGRHVVRWDGRRSSGGALAPGCYIARLEAGSRTLATKLSLSR